MTPTHIESESYAYSGEFGRIRQEILRTFLKNTDEACQKYLRYKDMKLRSKKMALFFNQMWKEGLAYEIPVQLFDWEIYTNQNQQEFLRTCWRVPNEDVGKFPDLPETPIPDIEEFDVKLFRYAHQDVLYVDEKGDSFLNLRILTEYVPDQYQKTICLLRGIEYQIMKAKDSE